MLLYWCVSLEFVVPAAVRCMWMKVDLFVSIFCNNFKKYIGIWIYILCVYMNKNICDADISKVLFYFVLLLSAYLCVYFPSRNLSMIYIGNFFSLHWKRKFSVEIWFENIFGQWSWNLFRFHWIYFSCCDSFLYQFINVISFSFICCKKNLVFPIFQSILCVWMCALFLISCYTSRHKHLCE